MATNRWLWARRTALAAAWFALSLAYPPFGGFGGGICFACALIDMGMNGMANAEFAPLNLSATFLGFTASYFGVHAA